MPLAAPPAPLMPPAPAVVPAPPAPAVVALPPVGLAPAVPGAPPVLGVPAVPGVPALPAAALAPAVVGGAPAPPIETGLSVLLQALKEMLSKSAEESANNEDRHLLMGATCRSSVRQAAPLPPKATWPPRAAGSRGRAAQPA